MYFHCFSRKSSHCASSTVTYVLRVNTRVMMSCSSVRSSRHRYSVCEVLMLCSLIYTALVDYLYAVMGSRFIACYANICHRHIISIRGWKDIVIYLFIDLITLQAHEGHYVRGMHINVKTRKKKAILNTQHTFE